MLKIICRCAEIKYSSAFTKCRTRKIMESGLKLITEAINRKDVKVTIFVAITDVRISIVNPFISEDGNLILVNGASYFRVLEDIWPAFRSTVARHELW